MKFFLWLKNLFIKKEKLNVESSRNLKCVDNECCKFLTYGNYYQCFTTNVPASLEVLDDSGVLNVYSIERFEEL